MKDIHLFCDNPYVHWELVYFSDRKPDIQGSVGNLDWQVVPLSLYVAIVVLACRAYDLTMILIEYSPPKRL